ncbi:hypothetical protein [Granulicella tundricola]|uniref:Uncharacterized protein n=1 Tax=Granulicella tundricola (strain ATCC BAA-1859 / DSM 23138 / MP5ACTX9) TaxID=1198114 RepID=E8WXF2_GRATM|nr:hypothetical protein [Granulicella tundricola]ADW67485.1 hypothetical protein AciX9_0413 [Granulicella tundricola MP5ACTX9]
MGVATAERSAKASFREPDFSDEQIREVAGNDAAAIAQWADTVAKERGIRVRPRPNDAFIKAVSRLSDGVVDLDPVEELLVELSRAGVISSFQRGLLQVHYLG